MERKAIVVIAIIALLGLGWHAKGAASRPEPTPPTSARTKRASHEVIPASGTVVPARWSRLAFEIGGRVKKLAVEAGDVVKEGELLAQLDDARLRHAVAQAEAALAASQASLAQTKAGARPEEIAAAKADLAAAEAELARLKAGPKPEEITAAKAQMEKAAAVVQQAQSRYDKVAGLPGASASPEAVALHHATLDYEVAKANYEALLRGATAEEIAIAQARVDGARARLKMLEAGPRPEEVAFAEAEVDRARAALAEARATLEEARLIAPFDGTVGAVLVREGEVVSSGEPVIVLGDLSTLRVEVADLSEEDAAKIEAGQKADISFDALPGQELTGWVSRVVPMPSSEGGRPSYIAFIELDEQVAGLRWGMTAFVEIEVK